MLPADGERRPERADRSASHERFGGWTCEPSTLSLFHLGRDRIDPIPHLLAQDAIYVGGGSMRNMLAIWREHGIDRAMRAAWERGVVLAGLSAGAMCWFEGGVSKSGGAPEAVRGLGLLGGSLSVHLDGEPDRLPVYTAAVAQGELPAGYAADDGAALVFAGTALRECVASRPGARVSRVRADGAGGFISEPLDVRVLSESGPADRVGTAAAPSGSDALALSELRALRVGRRRLD